MCEDLSLLCVCVCVCGVWPSTYSIGLIQPKGPKPAFMRASLSRLNTLAVVGVEALVPPICAQPQVLPVLELWNPPAHKQQQQQQHSNRTSKVVPFKKMSKLVAMALMSG